jgi:hypothetical protein
MSKVQVHPLIGLESSKPAEINWLRYTMPHIPCSLKPGKGMVWEIYHWCEKSLIKLDTRHWLLDPDIQAGGIRKDERFRTTSECSVAHAMSAQLLWNHVCTITMETWNPGVFSEKVHRYLLLLLSANHRDVRPSSGLAPLCTTSHQWRTSILIS